ncbi:MAG TPA: hypothetical protein VHK27_05475 [Gammaproteobacteria bacterium]|nr:hypothetical protein [Gammaproteobacteria bacterium]
MRNDPEELVPGLETKTFAQIVLAAYVDRAAHNIYGGLSITMLAEFSGLSESKLARMRDEEQGKDIECNKPIRRYYYSPTKGALAKALAESLAIGADARAEQANMAKECRP